MRLSDFTGRCGRWIAEKTEKLGRKVDKWEYFVDMEIDENDVPYLECYCCEFVDQLQQRKFKGYCTKCTELCPLNWGTGHETGYICVMFRN